jgi:hypothetical protein
MTTSKTATRRRTKDARGPGSRATPSRACARETQNLDRTARRLHNRANLKEGQMDDQRHDDGGQKDDLPMEGKRALVREKAAQGYLPEVIAFDLKIDRATLYRNFADDLSVGRKRLASTATMILARNMAQKENYSASTQAAVALLDRLHLVQEVEALRRDVTKLLEAGPLIVESEDDAVELPRPEPAELPEAAKAEIVELQARLRKETAK